MSGRLILLMVFLSICGPGAAIAQEDTRSANWVGQGCRDRIAGKPASVIQGICAGAIFTLIDIRWLLPPNGTFCPPATATVEQAMRVIVAYLDRNPSRTHEPFTWLAQEALRETWPCR